VWVDGEEDGRRAGGRESVCVRSVQWALS